MSSRILLVEDNSTHRIMAQKILEDLGYEVVAMDNAYSALSCITQKPERYDLVLMDWEMPEMSGLEAVKSIRAGQVEKGWSHIPVIAFTSNKRPGDEDLCLAAGMDDYLAKEIFMPKWQSALSEKIEKWLNKQSSPAKESIV